MDCVGKGNAVKVITLPDAALCSYMQMTYMNWDFGRRSNVIHLAWTDESGEVYLGEECNLGRKCGFGRLSAHLLASYYSPVLDEMK